MHEKISPQYQYHLSKLPSCVSNWKGSCKLTSSVFSFQKLRLIWDMKVQEILASTNNIEQIHVSLVHTIKAKCQMV